MRRRIFLSGRRPIPARILSTRCFGFRVAGMVQVTAGWERINFNRNWPQLSQSNSAAQAGGWLPRARNFLNNRALWNGRFTSTAVPVSAARGNRHFSASRVWIFVEGPVSMIRSAMCLSVLFDPPLCPIMISVARSLLVTPYLLGPVVRSFETPCLCRGSPNTTQENQRTKDEASDNFDFRSFHCFLLTAKFVSSWPLAP